MPEDEALEQLSEDITGLVKSLNTPANDKQDPLVEPMLPVSETLLHQFNGRAVFSITNEITDERMSTAYWLSAPPEENDTEQESIPCDLAEMCRQLLPPEINICRESERICQVSPCSEQAVNDQLKIKRNALDQHRYMAGVDKLKRPFSKYSIILLSFDFLIFLQYYLQLHRCVVVDFYELPHKEEIHLDHGRQIHRDHPLYMLMILLHLKHVVHNQLAQLVTIS